jgi:hypothetical protein
MKRKLNRERITEKTNKLDTENNINKRSKRMEQRRMREMNRGVRETVEESDRDVWQQNSVTSESHIGVCV